MSIQPATSHFPSTLYAIHFPSPIYEKMLAGVSLIIIAGTFYCRYIVPDDMRAHTYGDCPRCRKIEDYVTFNLFTRQNPDDPHLLRPDDDETLHTSNFNPNVPTILYSHGFTEHVNSSSSQKIKDAYLSHGDYNIIVNDWGKLVTMPDYCYAVSNIPETGAYAAKLIKWLETKGKISLPKLHVIGFSLGAHVSALIGEEFIRQNSLKIGRITGLDPAGPAFDKIQATSNGLDKEDATFVDIIHTNTKYYGFEAPMGHVDFYVNTGKVQPGCGSRIGCSHGRAWQYYAESISNPIGFLGIKCRFWNPNVHGCQPDLVNYLGFGIDRNMNGIFSVKTNTEAPYAIKLN